MRAARKAKQAKRVRAWQCQASQDCQCMRMSICADTFFFSMSIQLPTDGPDPPIRCMHPHCLMRALLVRSFTFAFLFSFLAYLSFSFQLLLATFSHTSLAKSKEE